MTNARLEELRAKFQENPRRYFAPFANELRKSGDPAQAIAICRTHLATQPGHVSGHIVLGQALYEAGSATEARDVFTAALELDPENLIALRTLGEIAQIDGEFDRARQWYQRLLDADPRNQEVAQLLRDLPKAAASFAPPPSPEPVRDEPTPSSTQVEALSTEGETPAPVPASTFHTSFTGSGRAYDPDIPKEELPSQPEPETDPVSEPSAASADAPALSADVMEGAPFIDLEISAHDEYRDTPDYADAAGASIDVTDGEPPSQDTMELDEFAGERSEPAPEALPDESTIVAASSDGVESRFGPPVPDATGEMDEFGAMPEAPAAGYTPGDSPLATGIDPVRAVFAEHGFDGPVDGDEVGWLTTPSAAYSDPEAAPEDWFDSTTAAGNEGPPAAATNLSDAEQTTAADNPETDSWFDDPDGPSVVEPTDVADEFWLPPELPQVTAAEDTSRNVAEPEEMAANAPEASIEPDVPREPVVAESAVEAMHEDRLEFAERDPALVGPERQPAGNQSVVTPVDESKIEPATVEWDQQAAESMETESATPDESRDVHEVAAAAEEAVFVAHAGAHDEAPDVEPASEARATYAEIEAHIDAEAVEPAIPVYSGSASAQTDTPSEPSTPAPDPFITETLAELYLKQGFRDEALSIYRRLLQREPGNNAFRDRITSLESGVDAEPEAPEVADQTRVSSQSVRTFFSRLARRQPAIPVRQPAEPEVPFAAAASALANMFAASRPNPTDESAASTLSGAFTDPTGRPSRAAERELSLDHLFREVAPRETQGGGAVGVGGALSLDEFYSTPDASTASPTEPEASSDEASGSDIRQFTAWLEGLRKK